MKYDSSYFGTSGLYKNDPYRIKDNFNITSPDSLKGVKTVVFEVPVNSIPFTIFCSNPVNNGSDITVLTEKGIDIIEEINSKFIDTVLKGIRVIRSKFNKISFNLMGFMIAENNDPNFYKSEMFFYDLFINENWMDYPMFKQLLNKEEINLTILPEVFIGEFNQDTLRTFLNTSSKLNLAYPIEKMLIKPFLEPYGQSVRNSVGFFEMEALKPVEEPTKEIEIVPEKKINKKEEKIEDDNVFEKVKNVFDTFMDNKNEWDILIANTKIDLKKENRMFLFGFVRTTLSSYIYTHWDALITINTFDIKKIEKAIGHYAFLFCKKNFNFFGESEKGE